VKRRLLATGLVLVAAGVTSLCGRAEAQWNSCGVGLTFELADQNVPVACPDGAGGAIVAWTDHRSATPFGTPRWLIYAQHLDALGAAQWTADGIPAAPDNVAADTLADQTAPTILADGSGGAFIAWVDGREYPYSDIYVQHLNAAGSALWGPGGLPACAAVNVQQSPVLVSDGAGGVIVAWQDCRNGTNFDIYAQRLDANGAPQWTLNGVALCLAPNSQYRPRIVPDGAGGAIVCWYDYRSLIGVSGNSDIYLQRVNASGVPQWATDGILAFQVQSGEQILPNMIPDGAGGAILAYQDSRSGLSYDIYAQRVDGNGALLWDPSIGVPVCSAANNQSNPVLCTDNANGAIIAWQDQRKGANVDADIYAQRVTGAGAVAWTANGVPVCVEPPATPTGNQWYPGIVSSGASGGAIIAWYDARNVGPNLYTQYVDATGAPIWTTNGVLICGQPYGGSAHDMVTNGAGGAIIVWQDGRNQNTDIFAARVDNSGGLGAPSTQLGVGDPRTGGLALGAPHPNPTARAMTVAFTLPGEGPATIDLVDVAGRLVERHAVGAMGAGTHSLTLGRESRLPAGLYFVRLTRGATTLTARAAVVP
jgi:hypothetical protein